jgi:hypothetical protein
LVADTIVAEAMIVKAIVAGTIKAWVYKELLCCGADLVSRAKQDERR